MPRPFRISALSFSSTSFFVSTNFEARSSAARSPSIICFCGKGRCQISPCNREDETSLGLAQQDRDALSIQLLCFPKPHFLLVSITQCGVYESGLVLVTCLPRCK